MTLTLLFPVLLAATTARAGSWSGPVYTFSGTDGNGNAMTFTPGPYNSYPYFSGSKGLSGTATATFTWQPDPTLANDPPTPLCVLETAMANAIGLSGPSTADDGLGNPATISNTSSGTTKSNDAGSTGSRLTFKGTTSPVVLTCKLSTTCPQGFTSPLSYSVMACPISLSLGGTVKGSDGTDILIGQQCTARLGGGGGTFSGWQWKVGGTTFQSWSGGTNASYVDGPGPLNIATPSWYWNDLQQIPETVSCTATVTPPGGQGSPFTVTATKQVTVMVPGWTCTGTGGTMLVNTSAPNDSNIELWAGPLSASGGNGGMIWNATVTSPNSTLFGDGSLAIAQIITPDESFIALNSSNVLTTYSGSQNGQTGLDAFPYGWTRGAPMYFAGDAPGFDLTSDMLSAHSADQFVDYLMYQPPGSGQWVPLATFNWSTNGNATQPKPGGWAAFGSGSAGSVTPSGTPVKFSKSNSFPMWTQSDAGRHF